MVRLLVFPFRIAIRHLISIVPLLLIISLPLLASAQTCTLSGVITYQGGAAANQVLVNVRLYGGEYSPPEQVLTGSDGRYEIVVDEGYTFDIMPYRDHYQVTPATIWVYQATDMDTLDFTIAGDNGDFVDVAADWWLDETGPTTSHAWADADGDGDQDLYLVRDGAENLLLQNDGLRFTDQSTQPLNDYGAGRGACWGDFDGDGDQDLYLVNTGADPDSSSNQLFINNGELDFTLGQQGMVQLRGTSVQASWLDLDNDGLLDLFISRDNGSLLLLGSTGLEAEDFTNLVEISSSRGFAWADFDDNGLLDCLLTRSELPPIVIMQNQVEQFYSGEILDYPPHSSQTVEVADFDNDGDFDAFVTSWGNHNVLFINENSNGTFETDDRYDILHDPHQSIAAAWGDYDNDGWLDLYVVNIDTPDELYHNNLGTGFSRVSEGIMADWPRGLSVSWCDVDNDGWLDLFVPRYQAPNWLLKNRAGSEGGSPNHWLRVQLVGAGPANGGSNNDALGAKITIYSGGDGGLTQSRQTNLRSSRSGQAPSWQHFGLGVATSVDSILVTWPSGQETFLQSDEIGSVDRMINIFEPAIVPSEATPNQACTLSAHLSAATSASLFFRQGGETTFTEVGMTNTGSNLWTHDLPAQQVTLAGIQYYIQAFWEDTSIILPAGAPDLTLSSVNVSSNAIPLIELQNRVHTMCGMRALTDSPDLDLLFSDLGQYGSPRWRYWIYNGDTDQYVEHPDGGAPLPGQGFWIIAGSSSNISFSGQSTPLSRPLTIALNPGWNLIANPFPFPVPLSWITLSSGNDSPNSYHTYNAQSSETSPYTMHTTLQEGTGYFVWHDGADVDSLVIDIVGHEVQKQSALVEPDDPAWSVTVSARAGDQGDGDCVFGQRAGATLLKDSFDIMKPPAQPGPHVRLALQGLMHDWHGLSAEGQTWSLSLTSNMPGHECSVEFSRTNSLPAGWRLAAINTSSLEVTDLASEGLLMPRIDSGDFVQNWSIVAGPDHYLEEVRDEVRQQFENEVTAFSLAPAWPNPFPSAMGTTISLSVPKNSEGDLLVFDVRGRLVRTLHSGKLEQGRKNIVWFGMDDSGQRLASGVYFVRLTVEETRMVKKVTLLR